VQYLNLTKNCFCTKYLDTGKYGGKIHVILCLYQVTISQGSLFRALSQKKKSHIAEHGAKGHGFDIQRTKKWQYNVFLIH